MVSSCGCGKIQRKSYTTKKGVKVSRSCITDRGKPGKGPKVLPKLKKGKLAAFGYTNVKSLTLKKRRAALRKAIKKEGALSVMRRLNVVATFNKNTNPSVARIFKADANWISKTALKNK